MSSFVKFQKAMNLVVSHKMEEIEENSAGAVEKDVQIRLDTERIIWETLSRGITAYLKQSIESGEDFSSFNQKCNSLLNNTKKQSENNLVLAQKRDDMPEMIKEKVMLDVLKVFQRLFVECSGLEE